MFEQWKLSISQNDFPLFVDLSQQQNIETVKGGGQVRVRDYVFEDLNIFFYCILYRRPIFVEHCLSEGVNVNMQTSNGWTPLFLAVALEYCEITEMLIFYGANINVTNRFGITPLMLAIQLKNVYLVKTILKSRQKVADKVNTLAAAIIHDLPEVVKMIFQLGVDPLAKTKMGPNLIQLVNVDQIKILQILNQDSESSSGSYEEEEYTEEEDVVVAEQPNSTEIPAPKPISENTQPEPAPNPQNTGPTLNDLLEMVEIELDPPATPTYHIEFL